MSDQKKLDLEPKKVFFITSNQVNLDESLRYETTKNKGLINLKAGFSNAEFKVQRNYKRELFSVYINSVEIEPKNLRKEDQDPKTNKYKGVINLKKDAKTFPGSITFRASKNNFNYDFEFKQHKGWINDTDPPPQIKFSKLDQLKIYIRYMKEVLKKNQKDKIYKDLVTDSQSSSFGQKIYLDFFLEIFKNCYSQKEVKLFLKSFKLENILLPTNFIYREYGSILKSIEKKPEIVIQYCSEKEDKNKYLIIFNTLLLYVRFIYDREKALEMVQNKNIWQYLIYILPEKAKFFPNLEISEELINKMFEQNLTVIIITGILSYCGCIEKILTLINNKIEQISKCCIEEKKEIIMSALENPKKTDNIERIIEEIDKIIKYELNIRKRFISFNEEFWNIYIQFNDDVKKLNMINKAINLCSKVDKKLKIDNMNLINKIHKNGLDSIKNGSLKNEEIIEFINMDFYYLDNKYSNKFYRPLDIVKGLDFETMNDKFFELWKTSNIFKIYSFADNDFKTVIISQIIDMRHFGNLLKLFNYKDKKIFDSNLILKLREKFKNIVKTYKAETCPKFVEEISFFIYIIDYQKAYNVKDFMNKTIEKNIPSVELITELYIYLATNYKDISNEAINAVTDFLTKNKELLNAKSILFLLEKINSPKIIESLLNKIESFAIKEEELFNPEKEIESFLLLDGIQKGGLLDKLQFEDLNKTKYLMNALKNKEIILNKIKNGEINYYSFIKAYIPKNRDNFKDKLRILFFNNVNDVQNSIEILEEKKDNILKEQQYIIKLNGVLKEFFENEHKENIKKVEALNNAIKSGMMNEIEKPETKKIIEEIHNILKPEDLDHINSLKKSIFFLQLFRSKKLINIFVKSERKIFEDTEKDFKQLRMLFESENWINDNEEYNSIIKECFKVLKLEKKKKLKEEIKELIKIFEIKNFEENKIDRLEKGILTYNQKEEIFLTANSCMHLINELEAIKTDFYFKELDDIREGLQSNITLNKIENFGNILEKYGLKVLNPKDEDRNSLNILQCIYAKKGSVKFIANLNDKDIRNLQELVTLSDDTFVTSNEIQDMGKCSNFIHNLGEIKGKKTDKELIQDFIKEVKNPNMKGIEAHFVNYTNNSGQIQELFSKNLDKSQATLQQITEIMNNSKFILSIDNNQELYLNFEGILINDAKPRIEGEKVINYEGLIELRARAMLTKKIGDEKEKEIFNLYKLFSERVNEIEKINQLLKKLGEKGYSENIKIIIDIKDKKPSFNIDDKLINNYEDCNKYLDDLYNKITKIQIDYYKNEELIRYIYGRQFNLLNSCLKKEKNNALIPFLKFLTNDQINSKEKLKI